MKELLIDGINKYLTYPLSAQQKLDLEKYLEVIEKAPKDEVGKSLIFIACANFIKKGIIEINGKKSSFNFPDKCMELYEFILGKENINKIIKNHADAYHCSLDNICFNKETEQKLKRPNSNPNI